MAEYTLTFNDNTQQTFAGSVVKFGKGKKAVSVFGIRNVEGVGNGKNYVIDHIPSGARVGAGYYYLTLARSICEELIEHAGQLFTRTSPSAIENEIDKKLVKYIKFWEWRDIKAAIPYEEWLNGPDYEQLQRTERDRELFIQQEAQYMQELCESDYSLAYIPDPRGSLNATELASLVNGRCAPGQGLSAGSNKAKDRI